MTGMSLKIAEIHSNIEAKCRELGFNHDSWCDFLYSHPATFSPETDMWFIGLNPGMGENEKGDGKCAIQKTCTNEYHAAQWGSNGRNSLQVQVCAFFEKLSQYLGRQDHEQFMNEVLTANFFPFATRGWNDKNITKRQWDEGIAFSTKLWTGILYQMTPKVIVTLTTHVSKRLSTTLQQLGWTPVTGPKQDKVGWGRVKAFSQEMTKNGRNVLIIGLPHLSHYKIFSRDECQGYVEKAVKKISCALKN